MRLIEPLRGLLEFQAEAEIAYRSIALPRVVSDPAAAKAGLEKVVEFKNHGLEKSAKIEITSSRKQINRIIG